MSSQKQTFIYTGSVEYLWPLKPRPMVNPAMPYTITDIDSLDTPALVVYHEVIRENINAAVRIAGTPSRLRPHIKTHKMREVVELMMAAGITKFKCATIAEAELLGSCQAADVLLAYQPIGPKLERFLTLMERFPGTHFSCLVDHAGPASAISAAAGDRSTTVTAFLDLNVGMDRTGISEESALSLYQHCRSLANVKIAGVHAYDGHINDTDLHQRTRRADAAFAIAHRVRCSLEEAGLNSPQLVIGGSPTFAIHAKQANAELSPGTFVFWDKAYLDAFPDLPFRPAALVITRVVSLPLPHLAAIDLGHKSVAAENILTRRVFLLNAPGTGFKGHSEEHLVLTLPDGISFEPGHVLYGLPFHICPTCALYDTAVVIRHGRIAGRWRVTARDRALHI